MAQHDYNLANQSGADFRADLNNALSAIVTVNSGATAPSTTFSHQLWVDTSSNVLKIRNAANDAWVTTGVSITADNTFTGNITGNAATATALATARTINGASFDGTANISFNTDSVSEGSSNLYFTNARVESYLDAGTATPTFASAVINTSITGSAILDDDTFGTASATTVSTSESIKAYVDSQIGSVDTLAEILLNGNTTGGTDIAFGDNDKATFGNSDLQIFHDGSNSYIKDTGTGDLIVQAGDDLKLQSGAGENYLVASSDAGVQIYHDNSKKLESTASGINITGDANFNDGYKAVFGNSSDLEIYHDGSNSYISDVGEGSLKIQSSTGLALQDSSGNNFAVFTDEGTGGKVELYKSSTVRLTTTTSGIDVTGTVKASTSLMVGSTDAPARDLEIKTTNPHIRLTDTDASGGYTEIFGGSGITTINADKGQAVAGSALKLSVDATDGLTIDSNHNVDIPNGNLDVTGTTTTDGLTVTGTSYIQSTTQPQLEIAYNSGNITGFYRSGGDFQIKNDNGAGTPETSIVLAEDGAVTLYHDASAKLATTSTGIDVTGTVTSDGLTVDGNAKLSNTDGTTLRLEGSGASSGNLLGRIKAETSITMNGDNPASIKFISAGTSSGYHGGRIQLYTTNKNSTGELLRLNVAETGDIAFYDDTGTSQSFFWDASAERLGIGTSSPQEQLHIFKQVHSAPLLLEIENDGYLSGASAGIKLSAKNTNGGAGYFQIENYQNNLRVLDDGTEKFRIEGTTGNVGIGTDSPSSILHVSSDSTPTIKVTDTTNDVTGTFYANNFDSYLSSTSRLIFQTGGSIAATISASQKFGIGTTSPSEKIHVVGGAAAVKIESSTNEASLKYDNSTTTGAIKLANNDLKTELGGSEVMRILANGNFGIGTSSPSATLELSNASTAPKLRLSNEDNSVAAGEDLGVIEFYSGDDSGGGNAVKASISAIQPTTTPVSGELVFKTSLSSGSLTTAMTIDSSQRVGIGTTSPSEIIHTSTSSNNVGRFESTDGTAYIQINDTADSFYLATGSQIGSIGGNAGVNANNLNIDLTNGNVGIGTTSPAVPLEIAATDQVGIRYTNSTATSTSRLYLTAGTSSGILQQYGNTHSTNANEFRIISAAGDVTIAPSSTERVRVTTAGSVGIGTDSPSSSIDVFSSDANIAKFTRDLTTDVSLNVSADNDGTILSTGGVHNFRVFTNSSESARIDASGNLLVGKTSASVLSEGVEARPSGTFSVIRDDGQPMYVGRKTSDGTLIDFRKDGSTVGSLGTASGTLVVGTTNGSGSYLKFGSNVVAPVDVNGAVRDNAIDLGQTNARFKDLHLSGKAYVGSMNVDAGNADGIKISSTAPYLFFNDTDTAHSYDGSISQSGTTLYVGGATPAQGIVFRNKASFGESARFDTSGNLLVSTTDNSPVGNNVAGGIALLSNGSGQFSRDGGTALLINRKTSDGELLRFNKDGSTVGSIGTQGGNLFIENGNVGLLLNDTTDELRPAGSGGVPNDNVVSLGASAKRFKDLYLSGTGYFGTSVGIGTTSVDRELHLKAANPRFRIEDSDGGYSEISANGGHLSLQADVGNTQAGSRIDFEIDGSSKARLDSSGNFGIGTTHPDSKLDVTGGDITVNTTNTGLMNFKYSNQVVGSVTTNGLVTAYNTSSDARLKDVTGEARGLEVITKLNPVAYNWKADGKADEGLIAQEVKELVPNAVTGSEDEHYQMDYSKLVTHLVKGIKEQQEQIEFLKEEIANLKGE